MCDLRRTIIFVKSSIVKPSRIRVSCSAVPLVGGTLRCLVPLSTNHPQNIVLNNKNMLIFSMSLLAELISKQEAYVYSSNNHLCLIFINITYYFDYCVYRFQQIYNVN